MQTGLDNMRIFVYIYLVVYVEAAWLAQAPILSDKGETDPRAPTPLPTPTPSLQKAEKQKMVN